MRNSKIVRLIGSMEITELEQFLKFVESPYFNTNQNLISLLNFILGFAPQFDDESLDEKSAFEAIFQDKDFNGNKRTITKLNSRLFKLANQFIAVERLRSNDFEIKYNLLLHYRDKVLPEEFDKLSKNISQDIHLELISPSDFFQKFRLEREINRRISRMQDRGKGDVYFDNAIEALDSFYIYQKLIYTCQKLNRSKIIPDSPPPNRLLSILDKLKGTSHLKIPQINIWYTAYLMLSEKNQENTLAHYAQLKHLLMNDIVDLDDENKKALFTFLENKTIWSFEGKEKYLLMYDIYTYECNIGIFLHDKTSSPQNLKNYVNLMTILEKFDEAETFLEENKEEFVPVFDEYYQISRAILEFGKNEYEKSLDILNSATMKNIYQKLNEKRLRLQIYHHLGYDELIPEHINAYRVFIANNAKNINPPKAEFHRNFISLYLKISKNNVSSEELINEINQSKMSTAEKWLKSLIIK